MRRRHDPFLKLLYRAGARDAISLFFPHLAARIDWAQIRWIDKKVPIRGEPPRSVTADLVGLTRDLEGRYVKVLLHPEIQMEPDADMGWRVLQYNAGHLLQEANPGTRVLTFVFYHCRGAGGISKQQYALEFYDEAVHWVGYWSVGLGELEAEAYAQSDNPMAWALAAWMRQRRGSRVTLRLRLLRKILRFAGDAWYRRLLLDTLRTYFTLSRAEQKEEQRLLQSDDYAEVNEMLQTDLGRLEERARQEGRQEGRQEAEQALQETLLEVIQSRMGILPEGLAGRVHQIHDLSRLRELVRRAALTGSLDEIEPLLGSS